MQYYNFENLVKKYSTTFTAIVPTDGGFDDSGDYQEQKPKKVNLQGAIIAHRESKVFKSNGAITQQDKALYMLEPLKKDLQGAKVQHDGKLYRIGSELENAAFTGVYAYNLQFVSAFNEVE